MNISSVVVHVRPNKLDAVRVGLASLPGVEVHADSGEGHLVVTIETGGDEDMTSTFAAIEHLPGVLSAALIYTQSESDPEGELSVEGNLRVAPQLQGELQ